VRLEVQAEVEDRLTKRSLGTKMEGDQESPETPVAVKEG
jgi:hypothetical protein